MENGVTDRLWDKDIQEFIEACKHEKLGDITLGYTGMDGGRKILNVTATYRSARGPLLIGYRWAENRQLGWLPEVFVGTRTAPASHEARAHVRLAWQSGMWRERRDLISALLAVTQVFFRAQMVRTGLDQEHAKRFTATELTAERAQELTLQTLNDLAFLYSAH
ncbi:hypothetical protein [Arthrobacter sp. UYCo732]|uniref:hypothetical protein n=1 Tax=Arthrobacter sp. UYCo732 TaxID=3156336 RepID=UPI003395A566